MELRPWLLWVVAAAGALVLLAADARGQKVFTNTWAVHIPGGPAVADRVARKHGFVNLGQIFGDYYHFWHRAVTKRSLSPHRLRHSRLQREPQIQWLEQQVAKRRTKRDVYLEPTDPKFPQQWYLVRCLSCRLHPSTDGLRWLTEPDFEACSQPCSVC